jgi:pimeloyl-ACP methyl ester carboxylesterase
MQAIVNGGVMTYQAAGRPGAPALILIHGFPLDSGMWGAQLTGLARHCFVVAPDLRGHGLSKLGGAPYSVDQHADDVAALMETLGIARAVIGGLSMGGYAVLAFWRRHADKAAGIALIDTRANADTEEGKAARDATIARIRERGVGILADEMLPRLLAPAPQVDAKIGSALRTMIERQPVEGMVGALAAMRDRPDAMALLTTVSVPAAVIVGEADAITPVSVAEEMARRLSDVRLTVVPGAGHMAPLEAPDAVNAALLDLVRRAS